MIGLIQFSVTFFVGLSLLHANAQLEPPPYNIVPYVGIEASSTCGNPQTMWCMVESKPMKSVCNWCNSANLQQRHNVQNLVHDDKKWWQSQNDPKEEVTILFSFQQLFHISEISVKPGPLPLPGIWSIEKSTNGITFKTLKRFVSETEDCFSPANKGSHCVRKDKENQIILVELKPSEYLMAIRIRLTKPHKLAKEDIARHGEKLLTFYTLQHVKILGECKCKNWYKECELVTFTQRFVCKCPKNKCGRNCDQCCPGYTAIHKHNQLQCIEPNTTTEAGGCDCPSTPISTTTKRATKTTTTTLPPTNDDCSCETTTSPTESTTTTITTTRTSTTTTPCECTTSTEPPTTPPCECTTTPLITTTTPNSPTTPPCDCSTSTEPPTTPPCECTTTPLITTTTPNSPTTPPCDCSTSTEPPTTPPCECTTTPLITTTTPNSPTTPPCDCSTSTEPPTTPPCECTTTPIITSTITNPPTTPPCDCTTTPETTTPSTTITTPETTTPSTTTTTPETPTTTPCPCSSTTTTPETTTTTPETTTTTTKTTTTKTTTPSTTTTTPEPPTTTPCPCMSTTTTTPETTTTMMTTTSESSTTDTTICPCLLPKITTTPMSILPPVVDPAVRQSDVTCRSRMLRNLDGPGLDINDWLCSITDIYEYPISKRWPLLMRDLEYKIEILKQMVQRAPDRSYFTHRYYELYPHFDAIEKFSGATEQRVDEVLLRCNRLRFDYVDLIQRIEEIFEIDANIYRALAYVKFVDKTFARKPVYYSDEEYKNEIEPLFHGIVEMDYFQIAEKVNEEFINVKNNWNKVRRLTSSWNYNIVFKFRERYEMLLIPERLDELNQRLHNIQETSAKARNILQDMRNADAHHSVGAFQSLSHESILSSADTKIFTARYNLHEFEHNMNLLKDYEGRLINHLKNYWTSPQLVDFLVRKERSIYDAIHNARASIHKAKRFTDVLEHNTKVSETIYNAFYDVLELPENFRDTMCYIETYPFSKAYDELLMNNGEYSRQGYEVIDLAEKYDEEDDFHQIQTCREIGDYSIMKKDSTLNLYLKEIRRDNDDIIDHAIATEQRVLEVGEQLGQSTRELDLLNEQIKKTINALYELQDFGYQADSPLKHVQPLDIKYNSSRNLDEITGNCRLKKFILTRDRILPDTKEAVKFAGDEVHKAERLADHVRSIEMRTRFTDIELKIKNLKEKIKSAKKIAESIKGAVRFESPGYRSVPLSLEQFPATAISHLEIDFKTDDGSGLILSTGNITEGLHIELKLGHSHLQVNIGVNGLTGFIQFRKPIVNNLWYHFDMLRLGSDITATVSADGIAKQSEVIQLQSPTIGYIPVAMPIYIAGIPEKWKVSKQDDFDGCLDKFKLNNKEISLFASESSSGFIEACIKNKQN